jgi:hypothetical protein
MKMTYMSFNRQGAHSSFQLYDYIFHFSIYLLNNVSFSHKEHMYNGGDIWKTLGFMGLYYIFIA